MYPEFLPLNIRNEIMAHMLDHLDREVCGLITLSADGEYTYKREMNSYVDPKKGFKFTRPVVKRLMTDAGVVAYVHTHPFGPAEPSMHDMQTYLKVNKPSVICARNPVTGLVDLFHFGDHRLNDPLDGRVFRYGVHDCWDYIRCHQYQKFGVKHDMFPRMNNFWIAEYEEEAKEADSHDMYTRHFASQGYVTFEPDTRNVNSPLHPQVGDVLLMQMGSTRVINHAAVYLGNNLIGHHRVDHKSGPTPLGFCLGQGYVRQWLRLQR